MPKEAVLAESPGGQIVWFVPLVSVLVCSIRFPDSSSQLSASSHLANADDLRRAKVQGGDFGWRCISTEFLTS